MQEIKNSLKSIIIFVINLYNNTVFVVHFYHIINIFNNVFYAISTNL